ncbi:hypothetical protein AB3N04_00005 (plasmid) [Alkalihalophilus sp. As8PL]|uniref:Phosphoadenosine phosphosulphate reductase domain-containing protein n=1 Tax=Alkalihalophilus sp. As8PL TaxID=3237103 RepID=A0AB39BML1_9BACI
MQMSFLNDDFRTHKKYVDGVFKTKQEIIDELNKNGVKHIFKILSFGGGTQSSQLLEKCLRGEKNYDYDAVVMSDVGAEPDFIHKQVEWWQLRQKELGNTTPFIITQHNSMKKGIEEMLMRYISSECEYQRMQLPLYCNQVDENGEEVKGGLLPRQCTVDFKIIPVKQAARQLALKQLGLKPNQRMPKDVAFIIDIGFSYDEMRRINMYQSPQYKYMYLSYPLVEENLTTEDSIDFLKENNMPNKRSRCYLCPFNCDDKESGMDWAEIIEDEPLSFLKACFFDEQVRAVQRSGKKMLRSIPYFHYKRLPLSEVYAEDYHSLTQKFGEDLNEWKEEWEQFIAEKYKYVESKSV